MNKNRLLKMGACALVGVAIGFGIDTVVKKHKQKEVKKVVKVVEEKEPNELDYAVKMVKIIFGSMILMSLISTVSLHFSAKSVESDDIWDAIAKNRDFNELNFTMMLCHILDTDESINNSDKLDFMNKVIDSGKFGEKAIEILKEQVVELMEVK